MIVVRMLVLLPVAKLADPVLGSPALTSQECIRSISYIRFFKFGVPCSLESSMDGTWPSVGWTTSTLLTDG